MYKWHLWIFWEKNINCLFFLKKNLDEAEAFMMMNFHASFTVVFICV